MFCGKIPFIVPKPFIEREENQNKVLAQQPLRIQKAIYTSAQELCPLSTCSSWDLINEIDIYLI